MLRVGVIGLGEVAQIVHLPVLLSLSGLFNVSAACDISPRLVREVGDRFNVPRRYATASELIAAGDLDAVLVCTSDEFHAEAVIEALEHDLHVLVEKPMCLSPREAESIMLAESRSNGTVMVGYMRRFAPAFTEAVALVPQLGEINYARVHDVIGRNELIVEQTSAVIRPSDIPQAALELRRERGRQLVADAIGNVSPAISRAYRLLCGLGSHDLSAMRELLGRPVGVHAARQWRDGGYIAALLNYGDYAVTYETGVDDQRRFDAHLEVYGRSAMLRVQYDTPYVRHLPTTLITEETRGDALIRTTRRPHLKDPYTQELEYFHDTVVVGAIPKTSPEDFLLDLDLFRDLVRHMGETESGPWEAGMGGAE